MKCCTSYILMFYLFLSFSMNLSYGGKILNTQELQNKVWPCFKGDQSLSGFRDLSFKLPLKEKWFFQSVKGSIFSPIVWYDRLYVTHSKGHVYCLDANSGKLLWTKNIKEKILAPPIIHEKHLIFSDKKGTVYALHSENGTLIWKFIGTEQITGSANIFQINGVPFVIFGSYDHSLKALHFKNGNLAWKYETDSFIHGTPSVSKTSILFGGCDGFAHHLNGVNGSLIKKIPMGSYVAGSFAVWGNNAYVGNYEGQIQCILLSDHSLHWAYSDDTLGAVVAAPSTDGTNLVVGSRNNDIYNIDCHTGDKKWIFQTGGSIEHSPSISKNKVFCPSQDGNLYILSLEDGTELATIELEAPLSSSPALIKNRIYIGTESGKLYCFEDNF